MRKRKMENDAKLYSRTSMTGSSSAYSTARVPMMTVLTPQSHGHLLTTPTQMPHKVACSWLEDGTSPEPWIEVEPLRLFFLSPGPRCILSSSQKVIHSSLRCIFLPQHNNLSYFVVLVDRTGCAKIYSHAEYTLLPLTGCCAPFSFAGHCRWKCPSPANPNPLR